MTDLTFTDAGFTATTITVAANTAKGREFLDARGYSVGEAVVASVVRKSAGYQLMDEAAREGVRYSS